LGKAYTYLSMRLHWLCLIHTVCSFALGEAPSYVFPDQFSYQSIGWVQDPYTSDYPWDNLGNVYCDYNSGLFRADEIWNMSAAVKYKMPLLYAMGVTNGDFHLQIGNKAYFAWINASGPFCQPTPPIMMEQHTFKAGTFVGTAVFNGYACNVFNVTNPAIPGYYTVGYIDAKENVPRGIYTHAVIGPTLIQAYQEIRHFTPSLPAEAEEQLFALPKYCA